MIWEEGLNVFHWKSNKWLKKVKKITISMEIHCSCGCCHHFSSWIHWFAQLVEDSMDVYWAERLFLVAFEDSEILKDFLTSEGSLQQVNGQIIASIDISSSLVQVSVKLEPWDAFDEADCVEIIKNHLFCLFCKCVVAMSVHMWWIQCKRIDFEWKYLTVQIGRDPWSP